MPSVGFLAGSAPSALPAFAPREGLPARWGLAVPGCWASGRRLAASEKARPSTTMASRAVSSCSYAIPVRMTVSYVLAITY